MHLNISFSRGITSMANRKPFLWYDSWYSVTNHNISSCFHYCFNWCSECGQFGPIGWKFSNTKWRLICWGFFGTTQIGRPIRMAACLRFFGHFVDYLFLSPHFSDRKRKIPSIRFHSLINKWPHFIVSFWYLFWYHSIFRPLVTDGLKSGFQFNLCHLRCACCVAAAAAAIS